MAFTKITSAGIGTTETVTLDGLSVINNESIGGNLTVTGNATIGGVLTYEDVTNVDSVGLITARNGIVVGSGITLSKDGDGFFTGIVTATSFYGDGSNLSNITSTTINSNADNRLITGSGTANTLNGESNLTFDGSTLTVNGDASFTTANGNNIVFDKSGNDLVFGDSVYARFGDGEDLAIAHDGSNSYIQDNGTGDLVIAGSQIRLKSANTLEDMLKATENGGVQLYYDDVKSFSTISNGIRIEGTEGAAGILQLYADQGDDNGDKWRFVAETDGILNLQDYGAGSWYNNIRFTGNTGGVILYQNNDAKFQTQSDGARVEDGGYLYFRNDADDSSSAIRNGAGSGENNLLFTVGGGDRWQISNSGHLLPQANDSYDIGEASYRVRNIYTGDLHCSNEGSKNDVDGTWGDYTIQEGESDLFLINNRSGKKYKFNLTEVS